MNNEWLSDSHIVAAQNILKKQFPAVDSLVSPLLGTSIIGFDSAIHGAVQIHNVDMSHWVTSTGGILAAHNVDLFDSLSGGVVKRQLRRQLVHLYSALADEDGAIQVTVKPVQQQRLGKGNCGPFSIAFATSVCYGIDPSTFSFSERSLRQHIREGFETGSLQPFPQSSREVKRALEVKTTISIHCNCYKHVPRSQMVQCDCCERWYHFNCIACRGKEIRKVLQQDTWHCQDCTATISDSKCLAK